MGNKSFKLEGNLNNKNGFSCKGYDSDEEVLDIKASEGVDAYQLKIGMEFLKYGLQHKINDVKLLLDHDIVSSDKIPVLYCYPETDKPLPVVIFLHGMFGDKIIDLHRGIRLAQEGFFVVIPDARLHGERIVENYNEYFYGNDKATNCKKFFENIKGTGEDISKLIDNLKLDNRIDFSRIGMSGISMGGYVTYLTVANDSRIKAAAPMISSPDWVINTENIDFEEYDEELKEFIRINNPINNYKKLASIPILAQNGLEDKTISINGVRKLDEVIKKHYGEKERKYSLLEYPDVGHEIPEVMFERVIKWFKEYL